MNRRTDAISVDRVVVRGAMTPALDVTALRGAIAAAVEAGLRESPLPVGRRAATIAVIETGSALDGGVGQVAGAVAGGIVRAAIGGRGRG